MTTTPYSAQRGINVLAILFLVLAIVIGSLWWRSYTEKQRKAQIQASIDKMNQSLTLWQDATRLASSTGRIALAGPVGRMQALRRETEALAVHECLAPAKAKLVEGMGHRIDGFMIFMSGAAPGSDQATAEGRSQLLMSQAGRMETESATLAAACIAR